MALLKVLCSPCLLKAICLLNVAYWLLWIVYCRTLHPLARVPGPLWPAVSRTWLMYHAYLGDLEKAQRKLHDRYGPLVRIAPNEVLCSDPAAIPLIYRIQKPLSKTDYYPTFRLTGVGKQADMFTDTDEEHHAQYRKIVMPAYTMGSVLKQEDAIDQCTESFTARLRRFAKSKEPLDLGLWLEMYAFDVIGRLLFGKKFGFLESGTDVGNYMESVDKALPFMVFAAVGPSYVRPLVMLMALAVPGTLKALKAVSHIREDAKRIAKERLEESEVENEKRLDIFSQFVRIIRGGDVPDFGLGEMVLESWVGIVAGADSTAIFLRAVFYYLMKHPVAYQKCIEEINRFDNEGLLSSPIKYGEASFQLSYTCACIKEAARIFPAFAIHMGRVAPPEGLELSGYYIPAGYRVAMNAAIVHRDRALFGPDADEFKPERWMDGQSRTKELGKGMLLFGAGTRTCSGKFIATVEVHKLVPEILRHFTFEMAHDRPWKTRNQGFIKQTDLIVTAKINPTSPYFYS